MSAEELAEEIEYQRVLLLSLDDNVVNREEAEMEIKAEIRGLERKLKALKQGQHNPIASTSFNVPSTHDDDPFASFDLNTATSKHHYFLVASTGMLHSTSVFVQSCISRLHYTPSLAFATF